jgi:sortase A
VQVGSIEIPKIGLSLPLFSGVNLATLDEGPGHWPGTALPGQLGNAVVAAHRVSHGGPFRRIDKLAIGDHVTFRLPGGDVTYEVTATDVVAPETIQIIEQTQDKTATLFACHPPGSTQFRYVVKLRLLA